MRSRAELASALFRYVSNSLTYAKVTPLEAAPGALSAWEMAKRFGSKHADALGEKFERMINGEMPSPDGEGQVWLGLNAGARLLCAPSVEDGCEESFSSFRSNARPWRILSG